MVAELLPDLLPGLAAEAFHAALRLGYALRFGSDVEAAAGLAYMIASHVAPPLQGGPGEVRIRAAALAQADALAEPFGSERFGARLDELVVTGCYPQPAVRGLDEIASLSLEIYRGTRNFFALYMFTAT